MGSVWRTYRIVLVTMCVTVSMMSFCISVSYLVVTRKGPHMATIEGDSYDRPLTCPTKPPGVEPNSHLIEDTLLQDVCKSGMIEMVQNRSSTDARILVSARHNLGYCNIPKIGSSFWFAAFGILEGKVNYTKSPDVVLHEVVDNVQFKLGEKFFNEMDIKKKTNLLCSGTMFLFVRNPYFRLLSAYVHKFVSPQSYYWLRVGTDIIKFVRANASDTSKKCGHDLTFTEFLTFITQTKEELDHHWAPIYQLCSPCQYPYKYIGKAETLEEDTVRILTSTNISSLIDYDPKPDSQVKQYMIGKIVQFVYHYNIVKNCTTYGDMVLKLWKCFKAKGYILHESAPPKVSEDMLENYPEVWKKIMLEKAYTTYKDYVTSGGMSAYSDQFAVDMYNHVPSVILYNIRKLFFPDFLLFGYDPQPKLLYANRTQT